MQDTEIALEIERLIAGASLGVPLYMSLFGGKAFCVDSGFDDPKKLERYLEKNAFSVYCRADAKQHLFGKRLGWGGSCFGATYLLTPETDEIIAKCYAEAFPSVNKDELLKSVPRLDAWVKSGFLVLGSDAVFAPVITSIARDRPQLLRHSIEVAAVALFVNSRFLRLTKKNEFQILILSLLHDLGKESVPNDILDKPRDRLTTAEVAIYEAHTQNLLLLTERSLNFSIDLKAKVKLYDGMERRREVLPFVPFECEWLVLLAHRILEKLSAGESSVNLTDALSAVKDWPPDELKMSHFVVNEIRQLHAKPRAKAS